MNMWKISLISIASLPAIFAHLNDSSFSKQFHHEISLFKEFFSFSMSRSVEERRASEHYTGRQKFSHKNFITKSLRIGETCEEKKRDDEKFHLRFNQKEI